MTMRQKPQKKLEKSLVEISKSRTFALAKQKDASLAQLVEQLTLNQWVQGSSP